MTTEPLVRSLSGVSPGRLSGKISCRLSISGQAQKTAIFCLSGVLVRNSNAGIARTSTENLLVRLSPVGRDRFSDKRPSLGCSAAPKGQAARARKSRVGEPAGEVSA